MEKVNVNHVDIRLRSHIRQIYSRTRGKNCFGYSLSERGKENVLPTDEDFNAISLAEDAVKELEWMVERGFNTFRRMPMRAEVLYGQS
jgi:hypothetical protein